MLFVDCTQLGLPAPTLCQSATYRTRSAFGVCNSLARCSFFCCSKFVSASASAFAFAFVHFICIVRIVCVVAIVVAVTAAAAACNLSLFGRAAVAVGVVVVIAAGDCRVLCNR